MANVTAFVMITIEGRRTSDIAQRIAAIEGVAEVYSVTGEHDLIAILRLPEYEQSSRYRARSDRTHRRGEGYRDDACISCVYTS